MSEYVKVQRQLKISKFPTVAAESPNHCSDKTGGKFSDWIFAGIRDFSGVSPLRLDREAPVHGYNNIREYPRPLSLLV
jgi:hypothetical protein